MLKAKVMFMLKGEVVECQLRGNCLCVEFFYSRFGRDVLTYSLFCCSYIEKLNNISKMCQ